MSNLEDGRGQSTKFRDVAEMSLAFGALVAAESVVNARAAEQKRQARHQEEVERRQRIADQGGGVIYHPQPPKGIVPLVGAVIFAGFSVHPLYSAAIEMVGGSLPGLILATAWLGQVCGLLHVFSLWMRGLDNIEDEAKESLKYGGAWAGGSLVLGLIIESFVGRGVAEACFFTGLTMSQVWHAWRHRAEIKPLLEELLEPPPPLEEHIQPSEAGLRYLALKESLGVGQGSRFNNAAVITIEHAPPPPGSYGAHARTGARAL